MLSHVNEKNQPQMVNVGDKAVSRRTACARAVVRVPPEVASLLKDGDLASKKGPVFHTAIIAGVMAAKRTHELIPFCHPLGIDDCAIRIELKGLEVVIECRVQVDHKTGVEMEALTGATVAALTVYDMCKAVSHAMTIERVELVAKTGGKSDVGP